MKSNVLSLVPAPLTKEGFAPFGDVIETGDAPNFKINNGTTTRFHDLARVEATGNNARVIINIFRGEAFALPLDITMLERHPHGSQAFMPLQDCPYLVVVAEDENGTPKTPQAFLAMGNQGVNYHLNVWHHPLVALNRPSDFLVVDRAGDEENLQEYFFTEHYQILGPEQKNI